LVTEKKVGGYCAQKQMTKEKKTNLGGQPRKKTNWGLKKGKNLAHTGSG